jgi:hypothetical protein
LELASCRAGDKTSKTRERQSSKRTHLADGGLKMVVCSLSMAEKKSVKAFAVSAFGVSFEVAPWGAVAAGVDDAYVGNTV